MRAALTHSIACVVEEKAPDHHPDFFPIMVMGAYRILKVWIFHFAHRKNVGLLRLNPTQLLLPSRGLLWQQIVKEGRHDLLESAAAALTHSIACVVEEKAPDHHPGLNPTQLLLPSRGLLWQQIFKDTIRAHYHNRKKVILRHGCGGASQRRPA
jgi:hypothetical protein